MRWERLFDDLEGEFEQGGRADLLAEVGDRTRREVALLRVADRLGAAVGDALVVRVAGAGVMRGRLVEAGAGWLAVREDPRGEALVPLPAVLAIWGLPRWSRPPGAQGPVAGRFGLAAALRVVARERRPVSVALVDGGVVTGTVDRVGADFAELADHPIEEPRRQTAVRTSAVVPFSAIGVVRWA